MSAARTYLDHNATTPVLPAVREAVVAALSITGNPSSLHAEGRKARAILEDGRRALADQTGAKAENIIFTSGGTEAAASLLSPRWVKHGAERTFSDLLVLATEHACVLAGGRFRADQVRRIPVDNDGLIDLSAFEAMLAQSVSPLVAVQHANNETGIIQPLATIAAMAHAHHAGMIVDAVQSFGKIPVSLIGLDVDALFVSAHKIGGPKGVGAIVFKDVRVVPAEALIAGGGQQKGFRAGTENVAGIAGFAAAVRSVPEALSHAGRMAGLRDAFETELLGSGKAVVFGIGRDRLPNTSLFALAGQSAETSLIAFDLAGFALSSGSACSSGKVKRSHVLEAMGVEPGLAGAAIRMSIGQTTTDDELQRFMAAVMHRMSAPIRNTTIMAARAA